ncbi:immunoglobulin-like domain-containing protein [Adlercreutzia sp. ZJ141]|uniref:immunoglobulin-like domain-containing protein n=1 Tax=Adlercreutzia sp. ZJ141 TaxID=2709406 RepID=UPI0013EC2CA9|nr:immunoglobulin-like domain-containing protein [Adlercreutzia sp. ZJ141]
MNGNARYDYDPYGADQDQARRREQARRRLETRQRGGGAPTSNEHGFSYYDMPSNRMHESASQYSRTRGSYTASSRRRRLPLVAAAIALVLVVVGVGVAGAALLKSGDSTTESQESTHSLLGFSDAKAPSEASSEAPVADGVTMTLGGSKDTYVLVGEDYLEAGCHAVDTEEGNITSTVQVSGEVDTSKPGDYTVTYAATTSDGAVAKAERTVHVVESFDQTATSLPVLMYHYVYTENDQPEALDGNFLLDTALDGHLRYLTDNGYYYPSFQEVKAFVEGTHTLPAKSVVLTFDDCEIGFLKYGIPVLERYGVPATSFVICSDGDASEKIRNYASEYVSFQSHSYAMHQAGSNVGRGGRIHAMTKDEIVEDLRLAQGVLGTTEAFAYPFGDMNENAQAAMGEAGVLCAFTIINDRVRPGDDPTALNRVRISGEYTQESFEYLVAPNAG